MKINTSAAKRGRIKMSVLADLITEYHRSAGKLSVSQIAQQTRAPATGPPDSSSVSRSHITEEATDPGKSSSASTCALWGRCLALQAH